MRATGRTTRAADDAIQELFMTGECHIWDHYNDGKSAEKNNRLFQIIIRRLESEHPGIIEHISINFVALFIIITIKNFQK